MARPLRHFIAGQAHHLVQTGHNKQAVFVDDEDHRHYLACLHACAREYRVQVHAYALMPDHVHLLVEPSDSTGLSRMMQSLGRRYVVSFNRRHGRSGTIWEGRFKASLVEGDEHLLNGQCFIELNPVRSGLASDLLSYPWTSAAHHLGLRPDPLMCDHPAYWRLGNTPFERQASYRQRMDEGLPEAEVLRIRQASRQGAPYGGAAFIARIEAQLARPVQPRPRGRPAKHPKLTA